MPIAFDYRLRAVSRPIATCACPGQHLERVRNRKPWSAVFLVGSIWWGVYLGVGTIGVWGLLDSLQIVLSGRKRHGRLSKTGKKLVNAIRRWSIMTMLTAITSTHPTRSKAQLTASARRPPDTPPPNSRST